MSDSTSSDDQESAVQLIEKALAMLDQSGPALAAAKLSEALDALGVAAPSPSYDV